MKKRKILVSLALASACLFSLAACGKTEEPTPTPAPTTTTTAAPTTTTQSDLAVKFVAKYSDGAADEELTALAKSVKSGSKVARPDAPEKADYKFVAYYSSQAIGNEFDFDKAITAATTIYAFYDKKTSPLLYVN